MLIAILVVCVVGFALLLFQMVETNNRIVNLEITLDEIKKQTDKLGTHDYK